MFRVKSSLSSEIFHVTECNGGMLCQLQPQRVLGSSGSAIRRQAISTDAKERLSKQNSSGSNSQRATFHPQV